MDKAAGRRHCPMGFHLAAAPRIVGLAGLLGAFTGSCARGRPLDAGGPLARRLLTDTTVDWHRLAIPGARLYLARGGSADRAATAVAESVAVIRREMSALLGLAVADDTARPADLFFLSTREEMRRLAGRPLAGFIQQGERTGVFVVTPGYRFGSLLRHELAHLYAFDAWGPPRTGHWLVEGFAVRVAGSCQGHSPDQLAAGALARQALVPLTDLATNFSRLPEDVALPQAGSVVGFLVRQAGLEAVRRRWLELPAPGHPLGQNGPDLEAQWLAGLRRERPAALDVPRLLVEGC